MPRDEVIRHRAIGNLLAARKLVDPVTQAQLASDIELFLKWLEDPNIKAIDSVIHIEQINALDGWPFYQFMEDKLQLQHLFDDPGLLFSSSDETGSESDDDDDFADQGRKSDDDKENYSRAAN